MTRRDPLWPAAAAAGLFVVAALWGQQLDPSKLQLDAPPLVGHWDVRIGALVTLPVVAGLLLLYVTPRVQELPWRRALAAGWGMSALWAASLAATDGADRRLPA